jgi:hypothetical protein
MQKLSTENYLDLPIFVKPQVDYFSQFLEDVKMQIEYETKYQSKAFKIAHLHKGSGQ